MYDSPTVVLDRAPRDTYDDPPTVQLCRIFEDTHPIWPVLDHDEPRTTEDDRLSPQEATLAQARPATTTPTLPILQRVLDGLHRL